MQQVENTGDPWRNYTNQNPQNMTFWNSHYLVLIIISTIGFGDFYPQTDIGKIFLAIYVLLCLVRTNTRVEIRVLQFDLHSLSIL